MTSPAPSFRTQGGFFLLSYWSRNHFSYHFKRILSCKKTMLYPKLQYPFFLRCCRWNRIAPAKRRFIFLEIFRFLVYWSSINFKIEIHSKPSVYTDLQCLVPTSFLGNSAGTETDKATYQNTPLQIKTADFRRRCVRNHIPLKIGCFKISIFCFTVVMFNRDLLKASG